MAESEAHLLVCNVNSSGSSGDMESQVHTCAPAGEMAGYAACARLLFHLRRVIFHPAHPAQSKILHFRGKDKAIW